MDGFKSEDNLHNGAPPAPGGQNSLVEGPPPESGSQAQPGPTGSAQAGHGAEPGSAGLPAPAMAQPSEEQVEALYQKSLLHLQNGEWEEAIAGFEEVLRLRPDHAAAQALLEEARLKAALEKEKPKPRRLRFRGALRPLLYVLLAANAILIPLAATRWAYARWIEPQRLAQEAQARRLQQTEQALQYLASRDYAAAEELFRALLAEDPDNPQLQQGLQETLQKAALAADYAQAEAAIAAQNWSQANELLQAIIARDPRYADVAVKLAYVQQQLTLSTLLDKAETAYAAGDWQQAVAAYESLRSTNLEYQRERVTARLFESYVQRGIELVRATKGATDAVRQARGLFEKALTLRPREPQVMQEIALADTYLQGQAHLVNGNFEGARAALQWVYDQQPDYAGGNAERLLKISRGEAPYVLDSTTPTGTTAVPPALVPGSAAGTPWGGSFERQYNTALQQGDIAFSAGNYAQAESAYVLATVAAIYSGFDAVERLFVSYVKLGTVYAKREYNELAVSALKTAIEVMARSPTVVPPTTYEQYVAQGDEYARAGDYAKAFAAYDQAIQTISASCNCGLENWSVVP